MHRKESWLGRPSMSLISWHLRTSISLPGVSLWNKSKSVKLALFKVCVNDISPSDYWIFIWFASLALCRCTCWSSASPLSVCCWLRCSGRLPHTDGFPAPNADQSHDQTDFSTKGFSFEFCRNNSGITRSFIYAGPNLPLFLLLLLVLTQSAALEESDLRSLIKACFWLLKKPSLQFLHPRYGPNWCNM